MQLDVSIIIAVIGVLVALTNIITEVIKKVTWNKIPSSILAVMVAQILTISTGVAYLQVNNISITWYIIISYIILAFMVSYAAMFGFDKLKEIMDWRKQ